MQNGSLYILVDSI